MIYNTIIILNTLLIFIFNFMITFYFFYLIKNLIIIQLSIFKKKYLFY